jgi:hypothetical protein
MTENNNNTRISLWKLKIINVVTQNATLVVSCIELAYYNSWLWSSGRSHEVCS